MLAHPPSTQHLPRYSLVEPASLGANALAVHLSNSIRRDVRLLAAMGAISDAGARLIASYLPLAAAEPAAEEAAVLRALAGTAAAAAAPAEPAAQAEPAKKLSRQRSETAPLRPLQPQSPAPTASPAPHSPRSQLPRAQRAHNGLGARLGAFFTKLTLDAEPSPRLRTGRSPPTSPPTSPLASSTARRNIERSFSDAPRPPQLAHISTVVQAEPRATHRVTVSMCPAAAPPVRRPSHSSNSSSARSSHSNRSSLGASTTASTATAANVSSSGGSSRSGRTADRSSGASTLATRKRSFTHLGLSMESLAPTSPAPQLRRAKPASNIASLQARLSAPGGISEGMARLAAPANSLGLVLRAAGEDAALPLPLPMPAPIRAQRSHNGVREPRSPGAARTQPVRSPAASTLAFPPMPSDACQAAMLSASAASSQLSLAAEPAAAPHLARALSDSGLGAGAGDAPAVLVATAAYDYSSSIKGDLEFSRGERIVVLSKVNDDWWFGSILPEPGRGSTGRSGMFPRSHVSFA
ncbi:hypothetical protein GGI07_003869 [Coemansia sp. Benny D115]|nr:hypothetical protein GGI07_003869 [Coemansia sp. Benny D115]